MLTQVWSLAADSIRTVIFVVCIFVVLPDHLAGIVADVVASLLLLLSLLVLSPLFQY